MNAQSALAIDLPTAVKVNHPALSYTNEDILQRLMIEAEISREEAKELFQDTLKFLVLTRQCAKLSPSARIDLGWHNLILFTREYADFCQQYFGEFIHHEPGSGLTHTGPMMDVTETAEFALRVYGNVSPNWTIGRQRTCGSGGC